MVEEIIVGTSIVVALGGMKKCAEKGLDKQSGGKTKTSITLKDTVKDLLDVTSKKTRINL